jgi:hypothetical protein
VRIKRMPFVVEENTKAGYKTRVAGSEFFWFINAEAGRRRYPPNCTISIAIRSALLVTTSAIGGVDSCSPSIRNANDVIITSEITNLRRVFDVQGVTAFNVIWKPVKNC